MNSIADYLTIDHKRCDDFFVEAENHVVKSMWLAAEPCFTQFKAAIEQHFEMEEQVLFPGFEQKTGSTKGPTQMMRSEHNQIRAILQRMLDSLSLHAQDDYLGHSETLNIMLQQHNLKEENILYPMTDQVLMAIKPDIMVAMKQIQTGS